MTKKTANKKAAPDPVEPVVEDRPASTSLVTQVQTALTTMNRVDAGIAALTTKFKGVIFDVATEEGMKAAKAARKEIATPRIELEKIRVEAKAPLLELQRTLDNEAKRIKGELEKLEEPIDAQITAEEDRIKKELEAKARAEEERVVAIKARIADIENAIAVAARCTTAAQIEAHLHDLRAVAVDESFQEFQEQAAEAHAETAEALVQMLNAAMAREAQQKALDEQQAEINRQKAEQAEADRKRQETDAAERARVNNIARYIEQLRGDQTMTASSGAATISGHIFDLENMVIGENLGEYQQQARDAKSAGLSRLNAIRIAAIAHENEQERLRKQREEQEAAQREADRKTGIQKRIALISEKVLAATECTLSVEVVRIVAEVEGLAVDESFGEFRDHADAVKKRALERLRSYQRSLEAGEEIARQTQAKAAAEAKAAREKEDAEKAEAERIEREADEQRRRDFRPTFDDLSLAIAQHYLRDKEIAALWIVQAVEARKQAALLANDCVQS